MELRNVSAFDGSANKSYIADNRAQLTIAHSRQSHMADNRAQLTVRCSASRLPFRPRSRSHPFRPPSRRNRILPAYAGASPDLPQPAPPEALPPDSPAGTGASPFRSPASTGASSFRLPANTGPPLRASFRHVADMPVDMSVLPECLPQPRGWVS